MWFTFTTNLSQQSLRNQWSFYCILNIFRIEFQWTFHDNLNSIVAGFIINLILWMKKEMKKQDNNERTV